MTHHPADNNNIRQQLRRYLLDTASDAERQHAEEQLETSETWQALLEEERAKLAKLDALPDIEPEQDLTGKVMQTIRTSKEKAATPHSRSTERLLPYAAMCVVIIAITVILLPMVSRSRDAARRASSQNNMKQLGLVLKMYANETPGELFPPLAPQEGVMGLDISKLYPKFIADIHILVNPAHPDAKQLREQLQKSVEEIPIDWDTVNRLAAESYTYLGWQVQDETELALLMDAKPNALDQRDAFRPGGSIMPLKEGIERFLITDINNPAGAATAQSSIPVMFEKAYDSHGVEGRNVLYMDGHVEFIRYGNKFPATPETDAVLKTVQPE